MTTAADVTAGFLASLTSLWPVHPETATVLLGLLVVLVFGFQKFNEPTFQATEDQPETLFAPKFLALRKQYAHALVFYLGALVVLFLVCSFAGTTGFKGILDGSPVKSEAFPLMMALIIVGLILNLKWIQQIERFFRVSAHRRAFIPEGARLMQTRLRSANFDFSKYNKLEILGDELFRLLEVGDFSASRNSVEHRWARFTCLIYALRQLEESDGDAVGDFAQIAQDLDQEFLSAYRPEYQRLVALHKNMQHRIAEYRRRARKDSEEADDLVDALQKALRRAYMFIGCAVRLRYPVDARMIDALARFGFIVKPLPPSPSIFYVIRWAALAVPALVFVAVVAGAGLLKLRLQTNEELQQTAIKWALSAILVHGSAAWAAQTAREHLKAKAEWDGTPFQIFKCAVIGGLAGFAILLGFSAITKPGEFDLAKIAILLPWILLPATTAGFTAYFFDAPPTVPWTRRYREAAIQGGVTALATYLVLMLGNYASTSPEMEYFVPFVALLIGGCLGFFLPHCHREFDRSPPGKEVQSRVDEFLWDATRIFGDEQKANEWLTKPDPSLRGMIPLAAAKSTAASELVRKHLREKWEAAHVKSVKTKRLASDKSPSRKKRNGKLGAYISRRFNHSRTEHSGSGADEAQSRPV